MNTASLDLHRDDALVAGVKSALARQVEGRIETTFIAIHHSRADILNVMNEQTWKLVGFVVVLNTLLVGAIRCVP